MLITVGKATAPKLPPLGFSDRKVRDAILAAIERIRDETTRREVLEALERGDVQAAIDAIRFDQGEAMLRSILPSAIRAPYELAGAAAAEDLGRQLSMVLGFDLTNPRALEFARDRSATLIREFGESSRRAIRDLIFRAFDEGIPPRRLAKLIMDSGIGLHDRYALAVDRYRRNLEKDDRDESQVDRMTERYAGRLLRLRAETIARTEILLAENEGQRELWAQAAEDGLIPPNAQREWVVAFDERLCEVCEPLAGETAPLGGTFPGGFTGPPAHPNCRCTEIINT